MKLPQSFVSSLVFVGLLIGGGFGSVATAQQSETLSIEHAQGTTVVPLNPKKVIILNPSTLDIADALDIPVAGVPKTNSHLPEFLKKYQGAAWLNAGTLFEPDYEALSHASPDIIFAGGRARDARDKLSEIAPVVSLEIDPAHFIASLSQRTHQLASIFGKQAQAETLLAAFTAKAETIRAKSASAGSAMVIMVNGGKMSAYTPGSRFGFIYDALGFAPAVNLQKTGTHGSIVSSEFILHANPDWLFVLDRDSATGSKTGAAAQQVLDNPLIRKTSAWQKGHVVYLDSASLYIAGGLQSYSRLMDSINSALSP